MGFNISTVKKIIQNIRKPKTEPKAGTVNVPTTSGYVNVPSDSPLASGQPGYTGSSGGGSSGGGSSNNVNVVETPKTTTQVISSAPKPPTQKELRELSLSKLRKSPSESSKAYNKRVGEYQKALNEAVRETNKQKNVSDYVDLYGELPKGYSGRLDKNVASKLTGMSRSDIVNDSKKIVVDLTKDDNKIIKGLSNIKETFKEGTYGVSNFIKNIPTPIKRDSTQGKVYSTDNLGRVTENKFKTIGELGRDLREGVTKTLEFGTTGLQRTSDLYANKYFSRVEEVPTLNLNTGVYGMEDVKKYNLVGSYLKSVSKEVTPSRVETATYFTPAFPYLITGDIARSSQNIEDIKTNTRISNLQKNKIVSQEKSNIALSSGLLIGAGVYKAGKGIFGNRLVLDTIETEKGITGNIVRTSEFKNLIGSKGKKLGTIEFVKIGEESLPKQLRSVETPIVIGKPEIRVNAGSKSIDITKNVGGFERTINEGQQTIVKNKKGKIIFGKENPFTKSGRVERENTLEFFKDIGIKEREARNILRLRQPLITERRLSGNILSNQEGAKANLQLREKRIVTNIGNIKSRGGTGKVNLIENRVIPSGNLEEISFGKGTSEIRKAYLTSEGNIYNKLNDAGKTTEISTFLIGSKSLGKGELPVSMKSVGDVIVSQNKEFELFNTKSLSKRLVPYKRGIERTRSRVLVEQGTPDVEIDLGLDKLRGFQGGGSKSSQEYLQNMWNPKRDIGLVNIPNKPSPKVNTIIKTPVEEVGLNIPSMVGGKGLTTINYAGTGQYEMNEIQATTRQPIMSNSLVSNNDIKMDSDIKVLSKIKSKIGLKLDMGMKTLQVSNNKILQNEETINKEKLNNLSRVINKVRLNEKLRDISISNQKSRSINKKINKPIEQTITIKPPKSSSNLIKTIANEIDIGESFEAFGFRFGKEISLGKGTKKEAEESLSKFLKGTLGASGFLKSSTGKKLKAEETNLLGDISFRKSKVNPFLVVEKKSKRLRKGGTGKEIQAFKKVKKRNLLGF